MVEILREFGRYFIGERYADGFAQGLLCARAQLGGTARDQCRRGYDARSSSRAMERTASPQVLENWRFQQALYRAYYDYYNRARLIYETQLENEALDQLRQAPRTGALLAMDEAEGTLNRALTQPRGAVGAGARVRVGARRCSRASACS